MASHQSPPSPDIGLCQEITFDGSEHDLARHTLAWCAVEEGRVPTDILDHLLKHTRNSAGIPLHANLGWLLSQCQRSDEAINRLYKDLDEFPESEDLKLLAAICLFRANEVVTSCRVLEDILQSSPGNRIARYYYAEVLMNSGKWTEGLFEMEKSRGDLTPLQGEFCKDISRLWMGQDLKGMSIVIVGNNRQSDEVQFVRFTEQLTRMGADRIGYACSPEMVEIMRSIREINRVDSVRFEPYHYFIPVESLPFRLGLQSGAISGGPYLKCNSRRIEQKRQKLQKGLPLLGICWRNHEVDGPDSGEVTYRRMSASLGTKELRHLLSSLAFDYDIVSLQQQLLPGERELLNQYGVRVLEQEEFDSFETVGETMSCLDQIITVDSPIAHLAGALGLRAHTLLHTIPGWKWDVVDGKSTWYPTLKIHQKVTEGDWAPCLESLLQKIVVRKSLEKAS